MVKTRKSTKRVIEKSAENEPPDIEEKRQKFTSINKSKYFENKLDDNPKSEISINIDSGISTQNNSCNSSLNASNSKSDYKIEAELDSDGSSSDEFMKAPFSLDDLGEFQTLKRDTKTSHIQDCKAESSISLESRLSNDSDDDSQPDYYDFSQIIKTQELIIHTKKEQETKAKNNTPICETKGSRGKSKSMRSSKNTKSSLKPNIKALGEELGISELLAIAEGQEKGSHHASDSDESNQEVNPLEEYSIPEGGVQITVELPNIKQKKKSKGFDMEAAVKRRMNLIRKENQVFMHKVHVLCWIAHGNYLNHIINNDSFMGLALSLIPSAYCYPPKHADLNYLQKLVEWFVKKVLVNEKHKLSEKSSKQSSLELLEIQINSRVAFSLRDLVLIFLSMVRSLGINARLVINLRAVPLRPPTTDLCQVSNKPTVEKSSSKKSPKIDTNCSQINKKSQESNLQIKKEKPSKDNDLTKTKINKQKKNKTNDKNDLKSPYFSSSDDIPLHELVGKTCAQQKNLTQKYTGKESDTNKIKNHSECKKKLKIEHTTAEHLDMGNKSGSPNEKSKFSNKLYDKKPLLNTPDQGSIQGDSKYFRKPRQSIPNSFVDQDKSSSEDDLGIPIKKKQIKRKKSTIVSKTKSDILDSDEEIFHTPKPSTSQKKPIDRRVLSSDEDTKKERNDYWVEVYLESEEKWINIDLRNGKVLCTELLYRGATQPVRYVVAWNNDGSAKDVTRRYAPQWLTVTRRQRAEEEWWRETMAPYTPPPSCREKNEDEDLDKQIHDKPLPSNITDYKNHPLFALKRHLLKFQAIYPPNAPPLGFVRGEPVYSRGCVSELHTREAWIKEAKLVRRGEDPYKIVKARPKWDKLSQTVINDLPLPLFGFWQVEDYIPPPAVDGKVPRNEYGNVELYKPCMLPSGTVHLQVPQLARVARKLGIDCAPAVVGWEFSAGGSHPVLDGFIVCEEFKEVLLDAWDKEMDESAKRAKERVEQRVYGNWKRLIKGLLIRERLKVRYDFGDNLSEKKKKNNKPKASTSKS